MTSGSPLKLILAFTWPLLIGNIFQQLYSISDIMIVGRLIGNNALAAVGATAPIYFMFLMIAFGFTGGLTVVTAQRFGAGDVEGVRNSIFHSLVAGTVLSAVISVCLLAFLTPVMQMMNVPEEIFEDAHRFMTILTAGMVMTVFYNLLSGFIRALGNSKTPLYFLIFSTVLNVLFNFILIYYFHLGVAGSAIGTVIAVTLSVVCCLLYMYRAFPIMHLKRRNMRITKEMMMTHLNIAVPMALQFSVLSFSIMIIQSVCNSFGPDIIAAFTSALRIEQLATQPLLALGITIATFSAQNWGAGKLYRIRQGVRLAAVMALAVSICISLLVRYVGSDMISVFLKEKNEYIIHVGQSYLQISTLFYFFLGMIFVFRNALQGMGRAKITLLACITELMARSLFAVYFKGMLGYKSVFYAGPLAWFSAGLVVMIGYIVTIRRFKNGHRIKDYFKNNQHRLKIESTIDGINHTAAE
jgi:putative MATE family efflux protein